MDKFVIPKCSIFEENGFVRPSGPVWNGHHDMRYHIFQILKGAESKEAVAFSYCTLFESTV